VSTIGLALLKTLQVLLLQLQVRIKGIFGAEDLNYLQTLTRQFGQNFGVQVIGWDG
jgi:hypothetical protein